MHTDLIAPLLAFALPGPFKHLLRKCCSAGISFAISIAYVMNRKSCFGRERWTVRTAEGCVPVRVPTSIFLINAGRLICQKRKPQQTIHRSSNGLKSVADIPLELRVLMKKVRPAC